MKRNQLGKVGLAFWVEFGKREGFSVRENTVGWEETRSRSWLCIGGISLTTAEDIQRKVDFLKQSGTGRMGSDNGSKMLGST